MTLAVQPPENHSRLQHPQGRDTHGWLDWWPWAGWTLPTLLGVTELRTPQPSSWRRRMPLGEAPASQQRVQCSGETVSGEIGDGDGLLCVWDTAAHSAIPAGSSAEVPSYPSFHEGQD